MGFSFFKYNLNRKNNFKNFNIIKAIKNLETNKIFADNLFLKFINFKNYNDFLKNNKNKIYYTVININNSGYVFNLKSKKFNENNFNINNYNNIINNENLRFLIPVFKGNYIENINSMLIEDLKNLTNLLYGQNGLIPTNNITNINLEDLSDYIIIFDENLKNKTYFKIYNEDESYNIEKTFTFNQNISFDINNDFLIFHPDFQLYDKNKLNSKIIVFNFYEKNYDINYNFSNKIFIDTEKFEKILNNDLKILFDYGILLFLDFNSKELSNYLNNNLEIKDLNLFLEFKKINEEYKIKFINFVESFKNFRNNFPYIHYN